MTPPEPDSPSRSYTECLEPQASWFRLATQSAVNIRKHCGVPDVETENRIVRAFRAALRPRRRGGRRPDQQTARAAELWVAGMKAFLADPTTVMPGRSQRALWQSIYAAVLPDFHKLDRIERHYRTNLLRRNVKAFLNRKGHNSDQEFMSVQELVAANM